MKNLQLNFKPLMLLLLVGFIFGSCSSEDDSITEEPPQGNNPAIVLDCDYFSQSGNIHLENVPGAPVDYIISCDAKIKGDLLIDAGVIIEFERNAGLIFTDDANYKIEMNGTSAKPIILTGVEKDKGYWRGLLMTSDNPSNIMKHVTVEFAGQVRPGGWGYKGAVIGSWGAIMTFDSCTIQDGQEIGLHWVHYAADLYINNSVFTRNDVPIVTDASHINSIDETSTYQGNVNDYVRIGGNDVDKDITFHNIDIPFYCDGFKPNNAAKRTFTFKPGVTLLMVAGSQIRFNNAFSYQHETIMVGTAEDRITIKGKEDVPGYWKGLVIESDSPLNEIAFLDISDAGQTVGDPNGAIKLESSAFLKIRDVNFINCFEYAMSLNYYYPFHLEYSNLTLDNTPLMFSDWNGAEVTTP
ncbi:hypothetical protein BZARG_2558 [Bizionia argentinensis JUB59]|uniref:Right-handed parallel beta-helix repeat-containing protein n=1 Tax=Bizionia argentinensis JUB59 TaxID=1046627 RepID=G2EGU1_9FLAO|nr:hypothetical protein [Bizionia argentinensis]EGV42310.2 hypothetical protein BZARG_2558 [Bizionia argentinensis JUB59]